MLQNYNKLLTPARVYAVFFNNYEMLLKASA